MRIITNTAALFRPEEGRKLGITVIPVSVSLRDRSLRDYIDISADEYVDLLSGEGHATSSQPAVGEIADLLETSDEETILLTVGDGLSGEYMTAMGLRNSLPNRERIHVIDSGSLGGPLRYLAVRAAKLRDQGLSANEIVSRLGDAARTSVSFVIPSDFRFLRRSGRVNGITSKIGGALRLLPVLTQSEDRQRILLLTVKRTWDTALGTVISRLQELGVDENYFVTVSYADREELAFRALRRVKERFPGAESELLQLSPSLITHGGPGCIVVQVIRKIKEIKGEAQ